MATRKAKNPPAADKFTYFTTGSDGYSGSLHNTQGEAEEEAKRDSASFRDEDKVYIVQVKKVFGVSEPVVLQEVAS